MREIFKPALLILLTAPLALFAAGCVSSTAAPVAFVPPPFMSREYQNIDKAKLLKACEAALTASDHDYKISQRSDNGFSAERSWVFVAVIFNQMGKSFWKVALEEQDGRIILRARSWSSIDKRSIPPFPVDTTAGTTDNEPYLSAALYKLFFDRVDYVLGRRQTWPTCKEAKNDLAAKESGAELESLCAYADSTVPGRI